MRLSIPIYIALLLLFSSIHGATIEVQLDEPPTAGTVICLLYNSANTFRDLRESYRQESFAVTSENHYRLADVPAGTYALVAFLDDNSNGFLDKNVIGIPREPIAFSIWLPSQGATQLSTCSVHAECR